MSAPFSYSAVHTTMLKLYNKVLTLPTNGILWLRIGTSEGSCECGEAFKFHKMLEILEQVHN
jgi:hypothetical protein